MPDLNALTFDHRGPGVVTIHLPYPVPYVLTLLAGSTPASPPPPGPIAQAAPDLTLRDPLADLEAQFTADELTESLDREFTSARALSQAVLADTHDGQVTVALNRTQVRQLGGWVNRLYLSRCTAGAHLPDVGSPQEIFGDADLAALTNPTGSGAPTDWQGEDPGLAGDDSDAADLLLQGLAIDLAAVALAMGTTPA